MPDHLRPTAAIAPAALLPGDPGRALALAQELLVSPRMANHARGLWGYTATTASGEELTIQSTGIGGPSVAVVLSELAALGVRRAVRLGTCRSLEADLEPGSLVVATEAVGADAAPVASPDAGLTEALLREEQPTRAVVLAGSEHYYEEAARARDAERLARGAQVTDLGTVATFESGSRLGVAVASALVVVASPGHRTLADEQVEAASLRLGVVAAEGLVG